MRAALLWLALIVAVGVAASLAMAHFTPVASAVQHFVRPGRLSPQHTHLEDQCTSCHQPTIGVTVENCTACHANAERLLGRQPTAFHASIEACTACHVEHQPESIRPLVMDHVKLARIGMQTLDRASGTDPESNATLRSLETWLQVQDPDQLDDREARNALNCAGCHDRRDPHFGQFSRDCAQCHRFESWAIAGFQHPSSRSKDCVQCHLPPPSHLMGHFSMVSRKVAGKAVARVDQCFECHNTTGWNDIIDVGFNKHH